MIFKSVFIQLLYNRNRRRLQLLESCEAKNIKSLFTLISQIVYQKGDVYIVNHDTYVYTMLHSLEKNVIF